MATVVIDIQDRNDIKKQLSVFDFKQYVKIFLAVFTGLSKTKNFFSV